MGKKTVQQVVAAKLKDAAKWCTDAHEIITTRADRIDTLDSIRFAKKSLDEAEAAIRETLP